jgi:F-type H+-transporting ATPase subunit b
VTMNSVRNLKRAFFALLLAGVMVSGASSLFAQASDDGRGSTPAAHSEQKNEQEKDENEAYKHSPAVKAFGKMVGMDVDQAATVFEIGNFVVLAVLVGWFLVKTLPKTFRDRTSAIQKHLVDARTATAEASARLNSVEERLSKLDGQIAAMQTQAEKDSAADEARIKASVEDEKKKILAAAEQEISAATVLAQRQLQKYAAELAIDQAARRLVVTAETDRLIVQDFARRLGSADSDSTKGGQN